MTTADNRTWLRQIQTARQRTAIITHSLTILCHCRLPDRSHLNTSTHICKHQVVIPQWKVNYTCNKNLIKIDNSTNIQRQVMQNCLRCQSKSKSDLNESNKTEGSLTSQFIHTDRNTDTVEC